MHVKTVLVVYIMLSQVAIHDCAASDAPTPESFQTCNNEFLYKGRLWKDAQPSKFTEVGAESVHRNVYFDPAFRRKLSTNHRWSYQAVAANQSNFNKMTKDPFSTSVAHFTNAVITPKGSIYASAEPDGTQRNGSCTAFQTGGCWHDTTHTMGSQGSPNSDFGAPKWYDGTVVSISVSRHETAVFHFVLEALASVGSVTSDVAPDGFYLHVSRRTDFVDGWIHAVAPELEGKIITGFVGSTKLLVPKQGCGDPSLPQILWMRDRVKRFLSGKTLNPDPVLVTRTQSRSMPGWNVFRQWKVTHTDHIDTNLGDVKSQLEKFYSTVVVAPHGAGLINILATPPGACVFEFIPVAGELFNICYSRLAYFLGHKYFGYGRDRVTGSELKAIDEHIAESGCRNITLPN